jgi:hypothetical protein
MQRFDRLILVYAGDSGLRAMLLDVLKKAVGREDCALCEITYGPLGKRSAWAACERRLGLRVVERHRDDIPPAWGISSEQLPCVLGQRGSEVPAMLVSREEIAACGGRVDALERRIVDALGSRHAAPSARA